MEGKIISRFSHVQKKHLFFAEYSNSFNYEYIFHWVCSSVDEGLTIFHGLN